MSDKAEPTGGESPRPLVRLGGVSKDYGTVTAVPPLDFDIAEGEFLALLGPSGCGKTTVLRMIGGFLAPTTGRIEIDGEDVTRLGPEKRRTNMVFQGYGLFPHMSVRANIAYGLQLMKRPRAEIDEKVARMLSLVRLEGFEDRMPAALSGGQAQRVALARALIMNPAVLLLDESLGALDLKLRKSLQNELREIHRAIGGTFVFVTHDQAEAMALATRIAIMKDGRIVQHGTPREVYEQPANEFVADFIGDANILRGTRRSGEVVVPGLSKLGHVDGPDGDVSIVVRPDAVDLLTAGETREFEVTGTLTSQVYYGTHVTFTARLANGEEMMVTQPTPGGPDLPEEGAAVRLGWHRDRCNAVAPE